MRTADQISALRRAAEGQSAPSSDFDLNPKVVLPEGRKLRAAGVLIAFHDRGNGLELLLTKRSSQLKHHPGQIAFPGGKQDPDDADEIACALREAREEVALEPSTVEILATLPRHETVTGFLVTPVLGLVTTPFTPRPEPGEVEEAFFVPFDHVTDPGQFRIEGRRWRGQRRLYYTAPYGPYYIWGATARMLRGLAERVQA